MTHLQLFTLAMNAFSISLSVWTYFLNRKTRRLIVEAERRRQASQSTGLMGNPAFRDATRAAWPPQ